MGDTSQFNTYGEELEQRLLLRHAPIAFRMLETEDGIPPDAVRPKRDLGRHFAMCQATAYVRRQRKCVAMTKEDHWCVWPVIGFGLAEFHEGMAQYDRAVTGNFVEDPEKARECFKETYPRMPVGKYAGFVMAPLSEASFIPELVIIYCKPAQLRSLMMAYKFKAGRLLRCEFDSVDSCVHSTIPALLTGDCRITIPDPGEYERGLTSEDEMIFTIPGEMLGGIVQALGILSKASFGYRELYMEMKTDFPRPQFYDDLFADWGLDRGEIWKR